MLSLHHITHAVSVVVICFLIKKYIELRIQHNDLKLMYDGLMLSCGNGARENLEQSCSCLQPPNLALVQSETGGSGEGYTKQADHDVLASNGGMFAADFNPSEMLVDDYGRTMGYADATNVQKAQASDTRSAFSSQQQLLPLDHRHPQLVQPSFTFTSAVSMATKRLDVLNARHDGKTEETDSVNPLAQAATDTVDSGSAHKLVEESTSSFDMTSESLEVVKLSPSSTWQHDNLNRDTKLFTSQSPSSASQSDFYVGSQIDGVSVTDKTEQQIFTTGSFPDTKDDTNQDNLLYAGTEGTPFIPNHVETSYDDDYEEWEEEEEAEQSKTSSARLPQQQLSGSDLEKLGDEGTSVECWGNTISDRTCHFQNLCFNTKSGKFVFLLSGKSVFVNFPKLDIDQALLEMSTVTGHNAQYFTYTDIPADQISRSMVSLVPGKTVIFRRFKPDNIMHVFHDDIIPLHHTLQSLHIVPDSLDISSEKFPISLFLADENGDGEFWDVYDAFAGRLIFTRKSLTEIETEYVCFSDAHIGLSKETTWYQYGFFQPQGPIPDSKLTFHHLRDFINYLSPLHSSHCLVCGSGSDHLVLILRKETRQILNAMDLVMAVSKEFRLKVMTVSFETHTLSDMIPIIRSSRGIIGMHGSLLSLAMFLRQGSILVELFPYAVNMSRYTPYKTLCEKLHIVYRAWANPHLGKSVPHPDWPPEFGGIHHLHYKQQQEILAQTEVPPHLCCEDPSWLYHIFQDTHVSIQEVLPLITSALQEGEALWTENDKNVHLV